MSELPKGWSMVTIGEIAAYVQRGKSPKYIEKSALPVINQKCVRWAGVDPAFLKFVDPSQWEAWTQERFVQPSDILWNSTGTGTIGRAAVFSVMPGYERVVVDSHVTIVRVGPTCDARYLHYYIRSPFVQRRIDEMQSGSTNQVELSRAQVLGTVLPLAPLAEQRKIVKKIDLLCDRQKRVQNELDKVSSLVQSYRQQILRIAFEGTLTERWREDAELQGEKRSTGADLMCEIRSTRERVLRKKLQKQPREREHKAIGVRNGISLPDGWTISNLGELKDFSIYGPRFSSQDYVDDGVAVLRTSDIDEHGKVDFKNSPKLPLDDKDYEKYKLISNDLLITRTGSIGTVSVFNDTVRAVPGAFLIHYRLVSEVNVWYVFYFLKSQKAQEHLKEKSAGTGRPNLNVPSIEELDIPIPSRAEQDEIVQRIERCFAACEKIEAEIDSSKQRLEALSQAVLIRAFEGGLLVNSSNDEQVENREFETITT